jgi:hypothetical protein
MTLPALANLKALPMVFELTVTFFSKGSPARLKAVFLSVFPYDRAGLSPVCYNGVCLAMRGSGLKSQTFLRLHQPLRKTLY